MLKTSLSLKKVKEEKWKNEENCLLGCYYW